MSGGNYDYLFLKEPEKLFKDHKQLERMAERLRELGHIRLSNEIYMLLEKINHVRQCISMVSERQNDVWRAVEWMDSGDYTVENVNEAVEKLGEW